MIDLRKHELNHANEGEEMKPKQGKEAMTATWIFIILGMYETLYWLANGGELAFILAVTLFTNAYIADKVLSRE